MSRPRTIFFATIAAGGGHVATARAMAESVEELGEGATRARVSDVMAEFGPKGLDARHKRGWRWMLQHPHVVRGSQRLIDAAPAVTVTVQRVLLDGFARRLTGVLEQLSPDLVVGNHGWLATALALAKRRHGLRIPTLSYVTEPLDANALWAEPTVERTLVASLEARNHLERLGVPGDSIDVVGYPVQRRFRRAPERSQARRDLGLEERFTCLVSLGAEGVAGRPADVVRALAGNGTQVVVIAGRNERLAMELQGVADAAPGVHIRGFVDDMERYVAAADVVVGKAGPASVMEALAVGRPLIITAYAALNERRIVDFVQSHGFGAFAPDDASLLAAVERLRSDPASHHEAEMRIDALGFEHMTSAVGRYLLAYANTGRRPEPWEDTGLA